MHFWRWLGWALLLTSATAQADTVADLVRGHIEAIGGRERIAANKTMRAAGHVSTAGRVLKFELLAQRPNHIRVTTTGDGRTLIQGYDGAAPPWRLEPDKSPVAQRMDNIEAVDFIAEAEFDDQLVDPEKRGYALDYAGEMNYEGRKVHKLLVTTLRQKSYFLLLDAETCLIVAQLVQRDLPSGRTVTMETRYDDFTPLEGVLLPRRIGIYAEGKLLHETVLETWEANVAIKPGTFTMPERGGAP